MVVIEGRVQRAAPGQRIVIYSLSGTWWVQPFAASPFTEIRSNSAWQASIHSGTEYAALLVEPGYAPPPNIAQLPAKGGPIRALSKTKGKGYSDLPVPKTKILHFSGYDWEARPLFSPRGGRINFYTPDNAWVDAHGFLHLRITPRGDDWECSELRLMTSLGEGAYLFTVRDVSQMEPAAVLTLFTYDETAIGQYHRELDVEISRWGDPTAENTQYLIQPYYEPANVFRFETPPGRVTYSFRWQPGKVSFLTVRGNGTGGQAPAVSAHTFGSGVPTPGGEFVLINLYAFGRARTPMRARSEVVIEKFEFLP
jgi:hypothetical protein